MDEAIPFLFLQWLWHMGVAALLCLPLLVFGRKRARWQCWEVLVLVIPFWLWATLMLMGGKDKSMANLGEAWIISLLIPLAALVRVVVGYRDRQPFYPKLLLLLLCGAAVALYLLMPALPER